MSKFNVFGPDIRPSVSWSNILASVRQQMLWENIFLTFAMHWSSVIHSNRWYIAPIIQNILVLPRIPRTLSDGPLCLDHWTTRWSMSSHDGSICFFVTAKVVLMALPALARESPAPPSAGFQTEVRALAGGNEGAKMKDRRLFGTAVLCSFTFPERRP